MPLLIKTRFLFLHAKMQNLIIMSQAAVYVAARGVLPQERGAGVLRVHERAGFHVWTSGCRRGGAVREGERDGELEGLHVVGGWGRKRLNCEEAHTNLFMGISRIEQFCARDLNANLNTHSLATQRHNLRVLIPCDILQSWYQ